MKISQLEAFFWTTMVYASALTTTKFSFLLFYRRLFITARFKLVTSILGGVVLMWWLAVVIIQSAPMSTYLGYMGYLDTRDVH